MVTIVYKVKLRSPKPTEESAKAKQLAKGKRPGKHERMALRAEQLARKATVSRNLSNPVNTPTFARIDRDGPLVQIVSAGKSSANRDTLLGGSHTTGFHSSSIRGHKAGERSVSQLFARDGF